MHFHNALLLALALTASALPASTPAGPPQHGTRRVYAQLIEHMPRNYDGLAIDLDTGLTDGRTLEKGKTVRMHHPVWGSNGGPISDRQHLGADTILKNIIEPDSKLKFEYAFAGKRITLPDGRRLRNRLIACS
jgi:hypothetical protein